MEAGGLSGALNALISSEVSSGVLIGLAVLLLFLVMRSELWPDWIASSWEFTTQCMRLPAVLGDIRDHLQELRLTHEMMGEIKNMMDTLQNLLKDINSAAGGLNEEMEKFVTGNVRELKEFEGKISDVLKLIQPLDGLVRNGNDLGTRCLGEVAKAQVALDEALKIIKAELPQGLLAKKFDYLKDTLKTIQGDVNAWYKQENSQQGQYSNSQQGQYSNSQQGYNQYSNSRASDSRGSDQGHQDQGRTTTQEETRSISLVDSLPGPPPVPGSPGATPGQGGGADLTTLVMAAAQVAHMGTPSWQYILNLVLVFLICMLMFRGLLSWQRKFWGCLCRMPKLLLEVHEELVAFTHLADSLDAINEGLRQVREFVIHMHTDAREALHEPPPAELCTPRGGAAHCIRLLQALTTLTQDLVRSVEQLHQLQGRVEHKVHQASPLLRAMHHILVNEFPPGKFRCDLDVTEEAMNSLREDLNSHTEALRRCVDSELGLFGYRASPGDFYNLVSILPPVAPWEEDPMEDRPDLQVLALAATHVLRGM
ncbi:unnamed protein product [Symbiodinium sp. CCMP2592]|nr:unnamed protein product [Symbiodinium sp. CCMP2592]